ncbi:peptidase inhibitor family I36 protein [Streptomyces coeruleoprunus]|uniref:Peptidase inhibitor family I36 protein n=1 Tax=Streptomyces coeruleoprunus TaxID=285563 RepID=A0ABV9XPE3_9ACTN
MSLGVVALGVAGLVGMGTANAVAAPSPSSAVVASADGHAGVAAAKARVTKVKVWQDAKFKNRNTTFTENMRNLKKDGWNDTISSAKNLGNRTVTFYQHAGYQGASFSLAPGLSEAHFGDHSGMHDSTSSIRFS